MKLLFCKVCRDVVALHAQERKCLCGSSSGQYTDDRQVEYTGSGVVVGMRNSDLTDVLLGSKSSHDRPWWVIREGDFVRKGKE